MLWVYGNIIMFLMFSAQGPPYRRLTYVRLIQTSTDGPRAEKVNVFCIISDIIVRHKKYNYNNSSFVLSDFIAQY